MITLVSSQRNLLRINVKNVTGVDMTFTRVGELTCVFDLPFMERDLSHRRRVVVSYLFDVLTDEA